MIGMRRRGLPSIGFSTPAIYDNGFYAVITVDHTLYLAIICVLTIIADCHRTNYYIIYLTLIVVFDYTKTLSHIFGCDP